MLSVNNGKSDWLIKPSNIRSVLAFSVEQTSAASINRDQWIESIPIEFHKEFRLDSVRLTDTNIHGSRFEIRFKLLSRFTASDVHWWNRQYRDSAPQCQRAAFKCRRYWLAAEIIIPVWWKSLSRAGFKGILLETGKQDDFFCLSNEKTRFNPEINFWNRKASTTVKRFEWNAISNVRLSKRMCLQLAIQIASLLQSRA